MTRCLSRYQNFQILVLVPFVKGENSWICKRSQLEKEKYFLGVTILENFAYSTQLRCYAYRKEYF